MGQNGHSLEALMADAATRLIHKAIDLTDDGDHEGAVKLLTRAIKANPANPQAYHERAMSLLNLDRPHAALADFDRALELDPKFPGARDWRARTLADLGEHLASAEERLLDLRDHTDGPHAGMGVSPQRWADCAEEFAKAGDPAKAVELLEEYLAEHASRVTAYACYETAPLRALARLLADAGQLRRAQELAARACASPHTVPADAAFAERLADLFRSRPD
jgi:predicted Zn-dependent protease